MNKVQNKTVGLREHYLIGSNSDNIEQKNEDTDKKIKNIFGEQLLKNLKVDLKKGNYLYIACENGLLEIVKELLKHEDIDINKEDRDATPLYIACKKGYLEIVKELLKHPKIDPNKGREYYFNPLCLTWEYYNPLYKAFEQGYLDIVKELLKHSKIDPKHIFIRDILFSLKNDTISLNPSIIPQVNDILFQMIIKSKKKIKSPLNSPCFKYAFSYVKAGIAGLPITVCKKLIDDGVKIPKEIKKSEKFKEIFSIQTKMFSEKSFQDLKIKHI